MVRTLLAVVAVLSLCCGGGERHEPIVHHQGRWDPFLDTLLARTLNYFLETTPRGSGLAPDRWPARSPSSIAAIGFALSAIPIAVEDNVIGREEGGSRVRSALRFLLQIPQGNSSHGAGGFMGLFYHFLRPEDGTRTWDCELSTVDTGLLMLGILTCESYFDHPSGQEAEIRALADSLYRRVDWRWAMNDTTGILMGWTPEGGYHHLTWHGYNEALFLYILALGSPTHPVPASAWEHWTSTYTWSREYGYDYLQFAPLFGHQFTQCWIDLRGVQDDYMRSKGIDYFENSRRATYAQRKYSTENPGGWRGYSDTVWGMTACDGPKDTSFSVDGSTRRFISYGARGISSTWSNDDGTIAPSAAGGSLVFAPEICIPALKAMRRSYPTLWSPMGYKDAFNLTYSTPSTPDGWFDNDYLGIDQGPILLMAANLKNEALWRVTRQNPYIVHGLRRAGFSGGWLDRAPR